MNSIEHSILKNLISNEDYTRKVLPFLKEEYFEDETQKVIFQECREFISKYDSRISYEACLLYTSPSPRDLSTSRMPSSA